MRSRKRKTVDACSCFGFCLSFAGERRRREAGQWNLVEGETLRSSQLINVNVSIWSRERGASLD